MYYLCKFFANWSLYDSNSLATRLLEKQSIESLRSMFPLLITNDAAALQTLQLIPISYNKLQQLTASQPGPRTNKKSGEPHYFICKVFDTWSLYDSTKSNTRVLDKQELDSVKVVFPKLMADENNPLQAFQFTTISYNKLLQLATEIPAPLPTKKSVELGAKVA